MSTLAEVLELGTALDGDPAFRDLIFAHLPGLRARLGKMTSSTSTATPMAHSFSAKVAEVKSPKSTACTATGIDADERVSDINALILDYLTMEGYPKAAANFCREANLRPQQEDSFIVARQQIKSAIHTGSIASAISSLNELDPEILDKDPQLHFSLLRLQLVELIRNSRGGDITAAINFATTQLAPRAAANNEFLQDLEMTMALLIFPLDKLESLEPSLSALLRSDLRRKTAEQVNQAILARQTERREAAIRDLVHMRAWAENSVRTKKKDFPQRLELGLDDDEIQVDQEPDDNGHEPMITT